MNIKAILFLLSCVISAAKAGHYLFWVGTAGKSDNMGMMLIAEELAQRGHEATVVGHYSILTKNVEGIREIVAPPENTKKLLEKIAKLAGKPLTYWNIMNILYQYRIEDQSNLMRHLKVEELVRTKHVDVLITYPEGANEASYFLAKKKMPRLSCSQDLCKHRTM